MKSALLTSSMMLAAAGGWLAATMFAPSASGKEPRFPQLSVDELNEAQKAKNATHDELEKLKAENAKLKRELEKLRSGKAQRKVAKVSAKRR